MANRSRLEISKNDIIDYFAKAENRIYSDAQLSGILYDNMNIWRLAQNTTTKKFTAFLLRKGILKKAELTSEKRTIERYFHKQASVYEIAASIKSRAYLSHYTAMFMHDLTDQVPKTLYITYEQPAKDIKKTKLQQDRIDYAFRNPVHTSKDIYSWGDNKFCLINGKYTDTIGVTQQGDIKVTNVERTLIDAAVRPVYSGGIYQVLEAYKRAKSNISVNKLVAMLKKINYIYPYHQVIGFYLNKAGYRSDLLQLLQDIEMKYDFYVTHTMKNTAYSKKWRLYYPRGF